MVGYVRISTKVIVAPFDGAASAEFIVFPGNSPKISADFLCYRLRARDFLDFAAMLDRGDRPRVKWDQISRFRFALPPISEQRQIIRNLQVLYEKAGHAEKDLHRTLNLASRYKNALLSQAFAGELAVGDSGNSEWRYARAADICEKVQSGGTPRAGFVSAPGIPFLKVYNIVDQRVDFDYRPQFVPEATHRAELRKSIALPGDVVMNIVGPPLGKVAIIPSGQYEEWNLNQALTLFRPSNDVSSKWLYYYLCGGESVSSVLNETRGQTGQVNISLSQCRDFKMPAPPREVQDRIVEYIEKSFGRVESAVRDVMAAQRLLPRLSDKALYEAFMP